MSAVWILAFSLFISPVTYAGLPFTTCVRTYRKLGCYKENVQARVLNMNIINDRDINSNVNGGHIFDWTKFEKSVHSLACRCSDKARINGAKVFGLQSFGECWIGENGFKTYMKYGESDKCYQHITLQKPRCNTSNPQECVGGDGLNYVYFLEPDDPCKSNPCANGGTCQVNQKGDYNCTCPAGYRGKNCDKDINECNQTPSPCQNGGTCINGHGGFSCHCTQGFTGKHCDKDFNECNVYPPCKNGAACENTHGGYICRCASGFTGKNCDKDIDECAYSNPCKNGGSCVNNYGSYICHCVNGFAGTICETDVNECSSNPCLNGGSCLDLIGRFSCRCPEGFNGEQCENDIDECTIPSLCKNGATCINTIGGFRCVCSKGFTGTFCKNDVDECTRNPCRNGGTCVNNHGSYQCRCPQGFIGLHCERDIDECQVANPCKNGATCVNIIGDYRCRCPLGYTGKNCDRDVDECTRKPCRNGGTCVNNHGSYQCRCPQGFTGLHCERDVDECTRNPCRNGGTCVNNHGSYQCRCPQEFTGLHCEKVKDIDGGYSQWSQWTQCNKSCGKGEKRRTRTCTNPFPHGNGKDCSSLGPANEVMACEIKPCGPCRKPLDLGIIMDNSGSITEPLFNKLKEFVRRLVHHYHISPSHTRVALIAYSFYPSTYCWFLSTKCNNLQKIEYKIKNIKYRGGWTRTDKALSFAGKMVFTSPKGDRNSAPNALVVFTDGKTSPGSVPYKDVLKPLQMKKVKITAVGIGDAINDKELLEIAMGNRRKVFHAKDFSDLQTHIDQIFDSTCEGGGASVNGGYTDWTAWKTCSKSCGKGVQSRKRLCTNPPPTGDGRDCSHLGPIVQSRSCNSHPCTGAIPPCKKDLDLAIILDSSESVNGRVFSQTKMFLSGLMDYFTVSATQTRVALIVYSRRAYLYCKFSSVRCQSETSLKARIAGMRYKGGSRRTDRALLLASRMVYKQRYGERPGTHDAMLIVTFGKTSSYSRPYSRVLKPLKNKGVRIIAVGIGNHIDNRELKEIAMEREQNFVHASSVSNLKKDAGKIISKLCS